MNAFVKSMMDEQGYVVLAHPGETLEEHIERCNKYYERINMEKDLKKILMRYARKKLGKSDRKLMVFIYKMFLDLIYFHDLGKLTSEFQRIKMKNLYAPSDTLVDESARHSMISAVVYLDYEIGLIDELEIDRGEKKLLRKIAALNAYVISRHHGRLRSFKDFIDEIRSGHVIEVLREKGLNGYRIHNIRSKYFNNVSGYDEWDYFYCRLSYSVLVACDYYAATENESGLEMQSFGGMASANDLVTDYEDSVLMKKIRNFQKQHYGRMDIEEARDINDLRSMMFLDAETGYTEDPDRNIYFIEMPTGSGKSNVAMDLAIKMVEKGAKKIFDIYPFNTLVEQNRSTMEKLFSAKTYDDIAVVNSLTSIKTDEEYTEDSREYYEKALLDRQFLNYPVILSTHVSFFDMLFGTRRESPFGFYQLCDAVVVLDEIQSYRDEIWGEIIMMLQACAELMGMKVIIMSATLPDLAYLSGKKEDVTYLLKDPRKYFRSPFFRERVKISFELLEDNPITLQKLRDHIVKNHGHGSRILVEFMFKKTADKFYRMLKADEEVDIPVMCITGDDSLFEREKILKPIKDDEIDECILISTQVLEAGADIDMDVGYKNISRLDSEEQFLGRINRSFRRKGYAYFFMVDDPHLIYGRDFRMADGLTLRSDDIRKALLEKDFDAFYMKTMDNIKKYMMEDTGRNGMEYFVNDILGTLDFKGVAKRLRLIEPDTLARDVFLGRVIETENGELIDGKAIWEEYKTMLKKADMNYAEKKVRLSEIRVKMKPFIYQIRPKSVLAPDDELGDLIFYESGEEFFKEGRLDRDMLEKDDRLFF